MDQKYIKTLSRNQRAAAGISIFIRLWLNGITRSEIGRDWTIAQLAMIFEITQAYQFRDDPHTITSLATELRMPIQTVSRQIKELIELRIVRQQVSKQDARRKYLIPTKTYSGLTDLNNIINAFATQWYRDKSWSMLDKAKGAMWYFPMDRCSDRTAMKQMGMLRRMAKIR